MCGKYILVAALVQHWSGFIDIDRLEQRLFADDDKFDQAHSVSVYWLEIQKQAALLSGFENKDI